MIVWLIPAFFSWLGWSGFELQNGAKFIEKYWTFAELHHEYVLSENIDLAGLYVRNTSKWSLTVKRPLRS